jgi:hypothetical protein
MTNTLSRQLDFPSQMPAGFEPLQNEPVFDAAKHLALERPDQVTSLTELGYSEADISDCPTDLGITSTFRVLSDEGAACLLDVCRRLEAHVKSNERISRMVRGGTYRSKFLRDLCLAPELTQAISEICQTPVLPHTIPHQLGHLNYNPLEVGENVDKWHTDTLRIDFVMFVTDPNLVKGGEFEYYRGTKMEAKALKDEGKPLDPSKIVQAALPGPGYAVLQQGNMVVHRAKGLDAPGERITMVNGYVAADTAFEDFCRFDQLSLVDPEHVVASEFSRHMTWMGRERLNAHLSNFEFSTDRQKMAQNLEEVAAILTNAVGQLRNETPAKMEHFGDE